MAGHLLDTLVRQCVLKDLQSAGSQHPHGRPHIPEQPWYSECISVNRRVQAGAHSCAATATSAPLMAWVHQAFLTPRLELVKTHNALQGMLGPPPCPFSRWSVQLNMAEISCAYSAGSFLPEEFRWLRPLKRCVRREAAKKRSRRAKVAVNRLDSSPVPSPKPRTNHQTCLSYHDYPWKQY